MMKFYLKADDTTKLHLLPKPSQFTYIKGGKMMESYWRIRTLS
jgi:hypothetical protein